MSPIVDGAHGTPTLFINERLHVAVDDEPVTGRAALATATKER